MTKRRQDNQTQPFVIEQRYNIGWRIVMPATLCLSLVAGYVILAFQFPFILYVPVGVAASGSVILGWYWFERARVDLNTRKRIISDATTETAAGNMLVINPGAIPNEFYPATATGQREIGLLGPGEIEAAPKKLPELATTLRLNTSVGVYGPRNAGKTNTALLWANGLPPGSILYVADGKKFGVNPWPAFARVADTAETVLDMVSFVHSTMMDRRDNDRRQERPVYLLVDEYLLWVDDLNLPIVDPFFSILSLGREYLVSASLTTGEQGVEGMNLKGRSGLRRHLTWIEARRDPISGQRSAWLDTPAGHDKIQFALPPQFHGGNQARPYEPTGAPTIEESEADKVALWVKAVQGGEGKSVACQRIFNAAFGGALWTKLDKALSSTEKP